MNSDLIELMQCLKEFKVKFLLIGGHAVINYTEPRYTKDLDLWVEASPTNAKRLLACLAKFGAPIENVSVSDFAKPGLLYVFGLPPNRVDILNRVKGLTFAPAYSRRKMIAVAESVKIPVVEIRDLMKLKKASGRPQDLIDLENLKSVIKVRRNRK